MTTSRTSQPDQISEPSDPSVLHPASSSIDFVGAGVTLGKREKTLIGSWEAATGSHEARHVLDGDRVLAQLFAKSMPLMRCVVVCKRAPLDKRHHGTGYEEVQPDKLGVETHAAAW